MGIREAKKQENASINETIYNKQVRKLWLIGERVKWASVVCYNYGLANKYHNENI